MFIERGTDVTARLAATPENQLLWVHRGEFFCSLEAQFDIRPYSNEGLACWIDMFLFHWGHLPPLILMNLRKLTHPMVSNAA